MRLPVSIPIHRSGWLDRLLGGGEGIAFLVLGADGRLHVERDDGAREEARLETDTTVYPWMVILRFRLSGQSRSFVLLRRRIGIEAHRKLRVWLRWRAQNAVSVGG